MAEIPVIITWTDYVAPGTPRTIEIPDPTTSVTLQDLVDTLNARQADIDNLVYDHLMVGEGKTPLNLLLTKLVGITMIMFNAQIKFEDRLVDTRCEITDGNLTATDTGGTPIETTQFSNNVNVKTESDVSAALISGSGGLTPAQEVLLENIFRVLGLDPAIALRVSDTLRQAGPDLIQDIAEVGDTTVVTRRP